MEMEMEMEMGSSLLAGSSMESVTEEIMREILLKLPTMDVGRCRCVSRQWRHLLRDESFVALHVHAAHVVAGPGAEALVVTESREHGMGLEMVVRNASSGKLVCQITDLSPDYRPAGTCNGLLLIRPNRSDWPVFVCNPITGEKAKIPAPPVGIGTRPCYFFTYAMGFSPSTGQYKLFRFSTSEPHVAFEGTLQGYMDVYTLGDKQVGSWRQHPHRLPNRAVYYDVSLPPALLDGKLYVLTEEAGRRRMLVIDVATEAHATCCLPEECTRRYDADAHPFEMCGRLWIAARFHSRHHLLRFWVMRLPLPLPHDEGKMPLDGSTWELRYTFYTNDVVTANCIYDRPSSAWFDGCQGMLCYRQGDCIYMYDTTKDDDQKRKKKKTTTQGANHSLKWDHQIQLPVAPSFQQWKVYGGYRPSLLSPHHLAFRRNDDKQQQFEHALGHALRCKQPSKKRSSTCPLDCDDHPVCPAKRVREPTPQ